MALFHTITGNDVQAAATLLRQGEVVAIPTETVYGLAGNALDENAVIKIFETKQRPRFNPLILHLAHASQFSHYVTEVPPVAQLLMERFMPGPLTLLLPKNERVPDLVTAGSPRVALRVPAHPLTRALLQSLDFPLAAPSANPFGYISPTTAAHVSAQLGGLIPYILDGGPAEVGIESTIAGFEDGELVIYRPGGLDLSEIEKIAGPLRLHTSSESPEAPGMLKSHYAPRKKLLFGGPLPADVNNLFAITFRDSLPGLSPENQIVLSPAGDLAEAAKKLFAALRLADASEADAIYAEKFPELGLGLAINDRLQRAGA